MCNAMFSGDIAQLIASSSISICMGRISLIYSCLSVVTLSFLLVCGIKLAHSGWCMTKRQRCPETNPMMLDIILVERQCLCYCSSFLSLSICGSIFADEKGFFFLEVLNDCGVLSERGGGWRCDACWRCRC